MNIGFSIPIHSESVKYINETFSQYKVVNTMRIIEDPIIHMYAIKDTRNEEGQLNGYNDSLFCEYHYYDTKNSTVYKTIRLHDGLWFGEGVSVSNVKLFKDGSTLIHLERGKYSMMIGQSVHLDLA